MTPPDGKLSVSAHGTAEIVLGELLPNKQYFFKVNVHVRRSLGEVVISSDIMGAKTPAVEDDHSEVEDDVRQIDVDLTANEVTSSTAYLTWRFFSSEEKRFVDGVQLRFTRLLPDGTTPASGVPGTSPFIHRDTNFFLLEDLEADTDYAVDLYLIPSHRARVELVSARGIKIKTTGPSKDPYTFSVRLSVRETFVNGALLVWDGVPSPQQKYVHLYQILFVEEDNAVAGGDVRSVFKEAKIDSTNSVVLRHLAQDTRYQVWLKAFLRNGKTSKSNFVEVLTSGDNLAATASPSHGPGGSNAEANSYYNSLLAASIIAAFAILALLIVTGFYLKRTTTYKAVISGGNRSSSSSEMMNKRPPNGYGRRRSQDTAMSDLSRSSFEMNGMDNGNKT